MELNGVKLIFYISLIYSDFIQSEYICESQDCVCVRKEIICRSINPLTLDFYENYVYETLDFRGCKVGDINLDNLYIFRHLKVLDVRNSEIKCDNLKTERNFTILHDCHFPTVDIITTFLFSTISKIETSHGEINSLTQSIKREKKVKEFIEIPVTQSIKIGGKDKRNKIDQSWIIPTVISILLFLGIFAFGSFKIFQKIKRSRSRNISNRPPIYKHSLWQVVELDRSDDNPVGADDQAQAQELMELQL